MSNEIKIRIGLIALLLLSTILYILVAYFINRTDTIALLTCWSALFISYFYIIQQVKTGIGIPVFLLFGIFFRVLFLWSTPALSDDYFRFIWDGYVWVQGINPFSTTPSELITKSSFGSSFTNELYAGLNSPNYYSVYPPLSQFICWLSVFLSPNNITGSIIIQRCIILLCEAGSIYIIYQLLKRWQISKHNTLLYALNPLVIIELAGNLHYEAVMIFFLLLAVYMLECKRIITAAIFFAMSVCTKLLPLVLLPLLIKRLGLRKFVLFFFITIVVSVLLFLPFITKELINNISESIGLYFQHFEFNASIFYIIRSIGFATNGYDVIHTAGKVLPIIFIIVVLTMVIKEENKSIKTFFQVSLIALFIYYMLSMVVHPWYISMLIVCSVFTHYRFALLWSMLIGFTYITYNSTPYTENLIIVFIEHVSVIVFFIYELSRHKKRTSQIINT